MIPVLYGELEKDFHNNGFGRLSDAISCTVTEGRNDVYELEMVYPVTGIHFNDLQIRRIIYCRHADAEDLQPFRIYRITKPLNEKVVVYAHHISYDLLKVVSGPFTATDCATALQGLKNNALNPCHFTFWTDKDVTATFKLTTPRAIRSALGGSEGSILDVYGKADYEWDGFTVKLHRNRGANNGVTIRYGKNLTDLTADENTLETYTGVVPYWYNEETGQLVVLPEGTIFSESAQTFTDYYTDASGTIYTNENGEPYTGQSIFQDAVVLNMTDRFEEAPTVDELRAAAALWLESSGKLDASNSLTVSFVALWQTEEYKNYAPLQRVNLCDTVTVKYERLGVDVTTRVIKTVYDVLLERYESIELGDSKASLAGTIVEIANAAKKIPDKGEQGEPGEDGRMLYASSDTASTVAQKIATLQDGTITMETGATVSVTFAEANSAPGPLLNVDGAGSYPIYTNGTPYAYWEAGATVVFTFDGRRWQVCSTPVYAETATIGNPVGGNVFIDSDSVDIRDGDEVLADFTRNEINFHIKGLAEDAYAAINFIDDDTATGEVVATLKYGRAGDVANIFLEATRAWINGVQFGSNRVVQDALVPNHTIRTYSPTLESVSDPASMDDVFAALDGDVVIERGYGGTDNMFTYEKWKSGKTICYGSFLHTVTSWDAWGSLYEGKPYAGAKSFPVGVFMSVPMVWATCALNNAESGGVICSVSGVNAMQIANVFPIRPNVGATTTYKISIYAIGTWMESEG